MRLFEASKILGAKYVVIHCDEYRTVDHYDEKEILEYECKRITPYVEYAYKNNLIVCAENVFEDNSWRYPQIDGKSRFTSRIEELKSVLEYFSSPTVRCCWDFGHAKLAFGSNNMANALCEVGKYIVCTHTHDNYYDKDLHLVPFLGDTNWMENMAALNKVGYKGKLSFELGYGEFDDTIANDFMKFVFATGNKLVELFDSTL